MEWGFYGPGHNREGWTSGVYGPGHNREGWTSGFYGPGHNREGWTSRFYGPSSFFRRGRWVWSPEWSDGRSAGCRLRTNARLLFDQEARCQMAPSIQLVKRRH